MTPVAAARAGRSANEIVVDPRRRGLRIIAIAALLTLIAGCSSAPAPVGSQPAAVSSVAVSPLASPTPAPTLTTAQLAAAYKACADTANKAGAAILKKYRTSTSLKAAKAEFAAYAKVDGTFIGCIRAVAWPAALAGDIHTLLTRETAVQVTELAMAAAKSFAVFDDLFTTYKKQNLASSSASNQVRSDLGLPPPPMTG